MLLFNAWKRKIPYMQSLIQIHKKAFIALVNDQRQRTVVDTNYKMVEGKQKLMLVFADGQQEIFKGLRAA